MQYFLVQGGLEMSNEPWSHDLCFQRII